MEYILYTRVMESPITFSELQARLASVQAVGESSVVFGCPYLLVDIKGWQSKAANSPLTGQLTQPTCPVIALAENDSILPPEIDLVASSDIELTLLTEAIRTNPVASSMLVSLLRHNEKKSVGDGLFAESLSYSCLQNGESFKDWLSENRLRKSKEEESSSLVLIERNEDQLSIVLNRPLKRNAYSADLRDALYEALSLATIDGSIEKVIVRGAGDNFSAGGDLTEFGEAQDGAFAHVARMTRNTGLLLSQLKAKTEFYLHGACIGAGIELPSFSDCVVAAPGTFFQLPEVAMGLIPGAGGTVSILNRIGRIRTAYMAISNKRIDTKTALQWGLIDQVSTQSVFPDRE
jgi:enoyl-CoA hydratase